MQQILSFAKYLNKCEVSEESVVAFKSKCDLQDDWPILEVLNTSVEILLASVKLR